MTGNDRTRRPGRTEPRSPISRGSRDLLDRWDPLHFAFVMATGILSIAASLLGLDAVGRALFGVNALAYVVVTVLTLARSVRDPRSTLADLASPDRAVGSFTAVAATSILGSQFVVFGQSTAAATALFGVAGALLFALTYTVFFGLTVRDVDDPIEDTLDGGWFLAVVATQSVAVLAALLAPSYPAFLDEFALLALVLYLVGGGFYLVLFTLVFYRLTFFGFAPESATPPYWINMGAVAITALAGSLLLRLGPSWPFLAELHPFLVGFTFFFWATGSWWIPLLVALGVWRHTVGGIALPHTPTGYHPRYWSIVFPLGMYTVSTLRFAGEAGIPILETIPRYFVYVALAAWLVVSTGLARSALSAISAASTLERVRE
ncbi:tellurite resistance/C4-dicarboxylate transporter family protein (plasmid) [Halobacterium sp. MBLA0001]|uniref:tellurite resistance/C4-dicarboxylate transporter family protein n=1 Tax=Halobacterium sp. MBLA0001 TaxID=3413511 RepID=UPI003C7087EB